MSDSAVKFVKIGGQYINPAHVVRVYVATCDTSDSPGKTRIALTDTSVIAVATPADEIVELLQA